ncbi:MAG TPA: T9SS type A sorting domain-containing protein, partial [Candidatus Acidoferrum sp.]|nr:T9SS type A sorting domain-containing protein [Candidatus Acidoferrum sp.]
VVLNMINCPTLVLDKNAFNLTVYPNQEAFVADSIKVTSSGPGEIKWFVAGIVPDSIQLGAFSGTTPSVIPFTFHSNHGDTGTFQYCFGIVDSSSHCGDTMRTVCVNVHVVSKPCYRIVMSDTIFTFTAWQDSTTTTPPYRTMQVFSSDSLHNFPVEVKAPLNVNWVTFIHGADTSTSSITVITPAQVMILTNPVGLPLGSNFANCVAQSTDSSVCDPKSRGFGVQLTINKVIVPSTDTISVATVPAVPGMQVNVPITFVNSCPIESLSVFVSIPMWPFVVPESLTFDGSRVAYVTNKGYSIMGGEIDGFNIWVKPAPGDSLIPAGKGLLANMIFVVPPAYTGNFAQMNPYGYFYRNCGLGTKLENPESIQGGIVVDTTQDFICGFVVDTAGVQIPGATVQLWHPFPTSGPLAVTTSTEIGSFALQGNYPVPFDLYAYKPGYYPGKVTNLNFGAKGVKIVLKPLSPVHTTSQWVDYYCATNLLYNATLPVGSVVEAITPGGLLVGQFYVTDSGKYGFMPVYRANDTLTDTLGAQTGEVITFLVNGAQAIADGDVTYPATYAKVQVCLSAGATETKTCQLQAGWNLVSWNMYPDNSALPDILTSLGNSVDVVLGFEGGGLTYDPELPQFSTLWSTDPFSGYWIKIKDGFSPTLTLNGIPVPVNTDIKVYSGWNLVSYLPNTNMAPADALASLGNTLQIAYGFTNGIQIYKPGMGNFNTLTSMGTCNGYWVKVNQDGDLVYPGGGTVVVAAKESPQSRAARLAAAKDVVPTTNWVNLYSANLMFDGKKVQAGAKITALSASGTVVGSFNMKQDGQFGFMPVYASTNAEENNGLKRGDTFRLTVNGVEAKETFTWTDAGARIEVSNLTPKSGGGNELPKSFSLSQNYPNPFNPTTTISFSLPAAGQARLEVFNILGVLVATPFDGNANAGANEVVWDGKDAGGRSVASGVYLYRLTSGSFTETRKMMLLK